jgi:endonuclease/exonuclease/phosphatase (EEP) superfamily protein YafD
MPIAEAYRRCPDAVYLRPDMAKYAEVSRQIFRVLGTLAPVVEHVSVDEAYQRPVSVTVVHPMPPIAPRYHRARNQQLRIAARESEPARRAGVLLGDLNATPCSSGLAGLADEGFRRATGLSPTWPAILGGLLGIPIDQVLVTPHWSVTTSGSGPRIGSDNFPVWARLSLSADEPGAVRR